MVGIVEIAIIGVGSLIALAMLGLVAYLFIKYYEDKKKNPDYVQKYYTDLMDFTKNNCPESIYDFDLRLKTSAESEGRVLGTVKGYMFLQVLDIKSKEGKEGEQKLVIDKNSHPDLFRHFVTFLPKNAEFSLFKPHTWAPKYSVAVISPKELYGGKLNGNVIWDSTGPDFYKWYMFSVSDTKANKIGFAKNIDTVVALDFAIDTWKNVGRLVTEASESDSGFKKRIREFSDFDLRRRS